MSDYISKNEGIMLSLKYIAFAILELLIIMLSIESRPDLLYKVFSMMALFQLTVFYFSHLKSYQAEMLNMYLSYGYNRKDIVKTIFQKMLTFILVYSLMVIFVLIASLGVKDALLLTAYKVVIYLLAMPVIAYSLFFNKKEYPWIFTGILIIFGLFIPMIYMAAIIGILFTYLLNKDLYKRNLV